MIRRILYCRAARLVAFVGIFGVAIHSFLDFGLRITISTLLFFTLIVIAVQNDRLADAKAGGLSGTAAALENDPSSYVV